MGGNRKPPPPLFARVVIVSFRVPRRYKQYIYEECCEGGKNKVPCVGTKTDTRAVHARISQMAVKSVPSIRMT